MAETPAPESETKRFICKSCKFSTNYQYFGRKPPFDKAVVLMEDAYVRKDPFSIQGGMITLGSHCAACGLSVCLSADCSIFYTKRFCLSCVLKNLNGFPPEIEEELVRKQQKS